MHFVKVLFGTLMEVELRGKLIQQLSSANLFGHEIAQLHSGPEFPDESEAFSRTTSLSKST